MESFVLPGNIQPQIDRDTHTCTECRLSFIGNALIARKRGTQKLHILCANCAKKLGLLAAGATIKNWNDPTTVITPGMEAVSGETKDQPG